jgi:HAD superfamily, subfamily IIIB (Acid phosphatase)
MRRMLVPCAVAAVLGATSYAIAADPPAVVSYKAAGGTYTGVRPTAVGLPSIGQTGTVGASDFASRLSDYHDSGDYDRDLAAVGAQAKAYLQTRLDQNAAPAKRTCRRRYRKVKGRKLYRRVRTCRAVAPPRFTGKPAIVLDIDETSLSNYSGLQASGFSAAGTVAPAIAGTGAAIAPTLELFRFAKASGVAVFFVTGRPSAVSGPTQSNLKAVGYDGWDGLSFKPGDKTTLQYKSGERAALEDKGYDIVVNLGDQESDLDGGHADKAFKYANPFYFISD